MKVDTFSAKPPMSTSGFGSLHATHLSALLHVLLQTFDRLPAHTFTLWTTDPALGHDLQLPTFLRTSWKS